MPSKRTKARAPRYMERLAEDEYVQEQLRTAAERLLAAYRRAARQGPRATEDKKVYDRVREAVVSIRRAVGALEEPPPKKRRRLPEGLLLLGAAGAAAYALTRGARREQSPLEAGDNGTAAWAAAERVA